MPRIIACSCGKKLRVPDGFTADVAKCPACGNNVQIPPAEDSDAYLHRIVGACQACAKPISLEQRERFGYFCDEACLQRAKDLFPTITPAEAALLESRARTTAKRVALGAAILAVFVAPCFLAYSLIVTRARTKWAYPTGSEVSDLTASRRLVCFTGDDGTLFALDARSGRLLWKRPSETGAGALLLSDDACIVAEGTSVESLDWRSGAPLWSKQFAEPLVETSADVDPAARTARFPVRLEARTLPIASTGRGTLLILTGGGDLGPSPERPFSAFFALSKPSPKNLLALDASSGEVRWKKELQEVSFLSHSSSGALLALATAKAGATTGYDLKVLSAETGAELLTLSRGDADAGESERTPSEESPQVSTIDALNQLVGGPANAAGVSSTGLLPFAVGEQNLYLVSQGFLRCIDVTASREKWSAYVGIPRQGPILAGGSTVLSSPQGGSLLIAAPSEVTEVTAPKPASHLLINLGPVASEAPVYILKCFDPETGRPLWECKVESPDFIPASPLVISFRGEHREPIGKRPANQEYYLTAFDSRTGRKRWEAKKQGVVSSPIIAAGGVLCYGAYDLKLSRASLLGGEFHREGPMNFRIMAVSAR